ncbi:myosuppressin [Bacillus rossius redtenbacheri]|uniref:myosuppressin n=1 Tax=Bacillus rossius redtenbacheri TaxID=93214 RepID=UPI002FDDE505
MKPSCARAVLLWAVAAAAASALATALPPPQCSPGLLEEVPPRLRKICAALSTIHELSSAMETYLLDDRSGLPFGRENSPLLDSGVKRQDVDHVFLRFGRR